MKVVIQAENRESKVIGRLASMVADAAHNADFTLVIETDPIRHGKKVAPPDSPYTAFYAKFVLLRDALLNSQDGDLIVWVDSDYAVKPNHLVELTEYVDRSAKSIFAMSYSGRINTSLIAIKSTPATRALVPSLDVRGYRDEFLYHRFGYTMSADEQIWNAAWEENTMGLNELLDIFPAQRFGALPQTEIFGNPIPHVQATWESLGLHFLSVDLTDPDRTAWVNNILRQYGFPLNRV